jgi:SPP1 gp7 family putative phage head morphogenesis protein
MAMGEKSLKAKPSPDEIRRKHERIITTDMKAYFGDELVRIRKAIGKKELTDIANAFWEHEDDILWKLLLKRLLASALSGAMIALDGLMEMGIGVEWALVNQAAVQWASKYSYQLARSINDTSQKFLQSAIPEWINSGSPLDVLIEQLTPTFGEVRANLIGVTEVTRSYAEGNLITWKESGVVSGSRWMTGEDELVCPLCEPLAGTISGIDENGFTTEEGGEGVTAPPLHPGCRCYLQPVVEL